MNIETVWLCNTCSEFTNHSDIKKLDTPLLYNIHFEGTCPKCKNRNVNSFLKDEPNPMFGSGEIEIVPIYPTDFSKKFDHESITRMTKQEIKDIYGIDLK